MFKVKNIFPLKFILICILILILPFEETFSQNIVEKNVFCYYNYLANFRTENGNYQVKNIIPDLCSHLVYNNVGINDKSEILTINPEINLSENNGLGDFTKFTDLKKSAKTTKCLLAIGGSNAEYSQRFSNTASDSQKIVVFINSIVTYMTKFNFDGIVLHWEYPKESDKTNLIHLVSEIKKEFNKHSYILCLAVSPIYEQIVRSYDIPNLSTELDFILLQTFDYNRFSNKSTTGNNSPLYPEPNLNQDKLCINFTVNFWTSNGNNRNKLILGLAFSGRSYELSDENKVSIGSPVSDIGPPGPFTNTPGFMGFNEICRLLSPESWTTVWDNYQKVPFTYNQDLQLWISFDNVTSIYEKAYFAAALDLGGVLAYTLDTDDFAHDCKTQFNQSYPLLRAAKLALKTYGDKQTPTPPGTTTGNTPIPTTQTTQTTATPSTEEFHCVKDGNYPNPKNCHTFFICIEDTNGDFVTIEETCPKGFYYDSHSLTCTENASTCL